LRKAGFYVPQPGWLIFVAKLIIALAALAAVLLWLGGASTFWLHASLWQKAGRLAGVVAAGMVVYFAALYLLGFRFADFNRRESASTLQ
jgi:putative peptidoglycan lipid II flippase